MQLIIFIRVKQTAAHDLSIVHCKQETAFADRLKEFELLLEVQRNCQSLQAVLRYSAEFFKNANVIVQ